MILLCLRRLPTSDGNLGKRRSERGGPSLRLWSPDAQFLQKYLAFQVAQLARYRATEPAYVLPVAEDAVRAPFRVSKDDTGGVFLHWAENGWAGFGRGNGFMATQVSQYASHSIPEIIRRTLAGEEF